MPTYGRLDVGLMRGQRLTDKDGRRYRRSLWPWGRGAPGTHTMIADAISTVRALPHIESLCFPIKNDWLIARPRYQHGHVLQQYGR